MGTNLTATAHPLAELPFASQLPRRAEAASAACGVAELRDLDDGDMLHAGNNKLSNTIATTDGERLGAVVDKQQHDLAAIIGIDGARTVEQRHAMLQGKS